MRKPERDRLARYYRAMVIIKMREAGHSLAAIAEPFNISAQRVHQILKRGAVPAQTSLPLQQGE